MSNSRESVDAYARARMSEGRSRVGVLDAVAVGLCAIGLLAIWEFQLLVVPRYAAMFVNFIEALPTMTRLVLQPVVASVASAVVLGLLGAGLYSRVANRRERGAALMLLAAVVPFVTVAFMFYAAVHKPMETNCWTEDSREGDQSCRADECVR